MRRREAIRSLSVPIILGTTGCLWEDNSSDDTNQAGNNDGGTSDDSGASTEEESNTIEESTAFTNLEIDGTKFVVELNQSAVDKGERLVVEYPNDQDSEEISPGITSYQFSLAGSQEVEVRPGTWDVMLQDGSQESINSSEFTAERNYEITDIMTLSQAGTRDENEAVEHSSLQITVVNEGPMPVALSSLKFNTSVTRQARHHEGPANSVMTAGEEETYAPLFRRSLETFGEDEAQERAGDSYQGTLIYSYTPTGEQHTPLTVEFGEEIHESDSGMRSYYHVPTAVHKRTGT